MKTVFGPVPSRRLGKSLGIDPIPLKTCNWNCVYCQLGRTRPLTNTRQEYIPCQVILAEAAAALTAPAAGEIDWVTFVGSGEPTLHSGLGHLIRQVKRLTPRPVAVITNGALLCLRQVRADLAAADAVLPSLDAGSARLYRQINRPWPSLTFDRYLAGLTAFRQEYAGQLWVEVMLVKDLNDSPAAIEGIARALEAIHPNQVHLILPLRPPAEAWVQPADEERLCYARSVLGQVAPVLSPAGEPSTPADSPTFSPAASLAETLLGIITRHPMPETALAAGLPAWSPAEIHHELESLEAQGKAQSVSRYGVRFWSAAKACYAPGPPG